MTIALHFDARWNIDATNMNQQVVAVALRGRDRVEVVDPFDPRQVVQRLDDTQRTGALGLVGFGVDPTTGRPVPRPLTVAVKARFAPHFYDDLAVSEADDDPVNADLLLRGAPRQADVYVYARHESSIEWIDVSALRTASVSWTPRRGMATGAPFVTTPYAGLPPGVVLRCDPWP